MKIKYFVMGLLFTLILGCDKLYGDDSALSQPENTIKTFYGACLNSDYELIRKTTIPEKGGSLNVYGRFGKVNLYHGLIEVCNHVVYFELKDYRIIERKTAIDPELKKEMVTIIVKRTYKNGETDEIAHFLMKFDNKWLIIGWDTGEEPPESE